MKISVDYSNANDVVTTIIIVEAAYDLSYKVKIKFNDGINKTVDFEYFLTKSQHPSIKKYLDLNLFQKFKIVDGNLNWNDYDLIFPVWQLYEGKIK